MLRTLLEQKRVLGVYGSEHDLPANLSANQWGLIENMLVLLQPFEELTREISYEKATAADVIPAITVLKRLLERSANTDRGVGTAKTTLSEAMERRLGSIYQEPLYTLATILDPR